MSAGGDFSLLRSADQELRHRSGHCLYTNHEPAANRPPFQSGPERSEAGRSQKIFTTSEERQSAQIITPSLPNGASKTGDSLPAVLRTASFPLGTGRKQHEIWHSGYYPVIWTNQKYRMIYFNMGHNDLDFETKPNKELSFTFGNEVQDRLILNALEWLGTGKKQTQ